MEVAGLILGVIRLTANVLTSLYQFYSDVKAAPARSIALRDELGLVLGVVNKLKERVDQDPGTVECNSPLKLALENFITMIEEMNKRIEREQKRGLEERLT